MIIFIYGPDTFRSREKLKEVIEQFQEKRDTVKMNVVRLDGSVLEFDRLRQEILTPGFLSPKKMIVVEGLLENTNLELLENVLAFLARLTKGYSMAGASDQMREVDEDNVLVFYEQDFESKKQTKTDQTASKIFTLLKKQKYSFAFPPLTNKQLTNWVARRVETKGGTINAHAVQELTALVGNNLWQLSHDIDKLTALTQGGEISAHIIEQEVRGKYDANIFALTDAIAFQDKSKALKLLKQELDNGANEIYLLTMIARQFRILLQLNAELRGPSRLPESRNNTEIKMSFDQLAKKLNLHPFVVKKSLPAANNYTLDQLKNIYQRLLKLDLALKTSHPNPELLLDLLIVQPD